MYYEFETADDAFTVLGSELLKLEPTVSPRGQLTRELLNVNITITDPSQYATVRTKKTYAFAEWIWYLRGSNTLEGIDPYAPLWKTIADENGKLNSNYGYYLFGQGQFNNIVKLLMKDWASRKAVIQIFQPKSIDSKDTTCSICCQFIIRPHQEFIYGAEYKVGDWEKPHLQYRLHQIFTIRSNDAVRGFPYDVMMFALFQKMLCNTLNAQWQNNFENSGRKLELGNLHYNAGSFHMYEADREDLEAAIKETTRPSFPEFDLIAQNELGKALQMEQQLRTLGVKAEPQKFEFASEFWQMALRVLTNKFCKPINETT